MGLLHSGTRELIVEGAVVIAPLAAAGRQTVASVESGASRVSSPRETFVAFAHRMVLPLIGGHLVPLIRFPVVVVPGRTPLRRLNRLASVLVYRFEACGLVLIPGTSGHCQKCSGPQAACTC